MGQTTNISFSVATIECIACTPVFKRELLKLSGIKDVKTLVMMNQINVEIDLEIISPDQVKEEILEIAAKTGFGGKVIFRRT